MKSPQVTGSDCGQSKQANALSIRRAVLVCAVGLLCWSVGSHAGKPYNPLVGDPIGEAWRWQSYPALKGLGLRCLAESKDGSIWFGVDDGVLEYDGLRWHSHGKVQGLASGPVNVIFVGSNNVTYAGSDGGVFLHREGAWRRLFPRIDMPFPVDDITESADGSIWVASPWGALRMTAGDTVLYTTRNLSLAARRLMPSVTCLIVPEAVTPVRQWSGREQVGIGIRLAEGDWLGTRRGLHPLTVTEVAERSPGRRAGIAVGDRVANINGRRPALWNYALNGQKGTSVTLHIERRDSDETLEVVVEREPVDGIFTDFAVVGVLEDHRGRMWFGLGGSQGGEIIRWDAQSREADTPTSWHLYTRKDGVGIGYGSHLGSTRDGAIWSYSNPSANGLNRFHEERWATVDLSTYGGSNTNTSLVQSNDGTVWVGGAALHALTNGIWRAYIPGDTPIPSIRTRLLTSSDGSLWVAGLGQEAIRCDLRAQRWTSFRGLAYQCEDTTGAHWFISDDDAVVRYDGTVWSRYGVDDGLMGLPKRVALAQSGTIWAAGSQDSTAASAQFDGRGWSLETHPQLSWGVRPELYGSPDGDVWLAAGGGLSRESGQQGGVLRRTSDGWHHYVPPEAPMFIYGVAQAPGGAIWFSGRELHSFSGNRWDPYSVPEPLASDWCESVAVGADGTVWVGTRSYGIYALRDGHWSSFDVRTGLADNRVQSIAVDPDGSVWAATPKGISRFDGRIWTTKAFPAEFVHQDHPVLSVNRDGTVWVSYPYASSKIAIRYVREADPPETRLDLHPERVSENDQATFSWTGSDWWEVTPATELQFSWRLDDAEWSPFSPGTSITLTLIPSGNHAFEVKARDRDFNVDPTPAVAHFTVLPPVWAQLWFQGLILLLVGAIAVQTLRVIRRGRRVREANAALSESNKSLFSLNQDLQQRTGELEEANEQLEELDRQKTDFFPMVSHDLRTPMTAVKGYIDNMLDGITGDLDPRQTQYLKRMRISADRLTRMVTDLLDLSRIERGAVDALDLQPARTNVLEAAKETVDSLSPIAESNQVSLVCEGEPAFAVADRDRVQQVVTNLVGNAMKFTEAGGEIRVSVVSAKNGFIRTAVRDTGIGILPTDLERIFDVFYQVEGQVAREPGSGLGLAISQKLVTLMGGEITAESEVGVGSTFSFTLPEASAESRDGPGGP